MKINSKTIALHFQGVITLLAIWGIPAVTYAQKISAEVVEIMDNRFSSRITETPPGSMMVRIEVTGLEITAGRLFKPGKITRAVDNLGNTIPVEESTSENYSEYNVLNFHFQSPERSASEISVLEGTVNYFHPTLANKGLVSVNKPADKLGTNILKGKYSDIVIVILDRKKLQKLKQENEKAYKQQLIKLKKEYGPAAESIAELNDTLDDPSYGNDNELFFLFYDPEARVRDLRVLSAEGENLISGNSVKINHISYYLGEQPLSNSMEIVLVIESPQAVKEYPFKLEKIKLP
ncbi:MAG: hypothetical protein KF870_02215 [Leadbetterella sp.]|nr:hypothetical protein [Leadbetterella sp.]